MDNMDKEFQDFCIEEIIAATAINSILDQDREKLPAPAYPWEVGVLNI